MRRAGPRPRAGRGASVVALVILVACGSASPSSGQARAAAVYSAVIEWVVGPVAPDETPTVYVLPRDGHQLSLEVQTEVINALAPLAKLRFIDEQDEALVDDDEAPDGAGPPLVRDEGILLRLGPVPERGNRVRVDVDRYVRGGFESWTLDVASSGDDLWSVETPASTPPTSADPSSTSTSST